jgi:hypothetical protein
MTAQSDILDALFTPLNIALGDFLTTTACDAGDLLSGCWGHVWNDTLSGWIESLYRGSPSALEQDELLQALIAAERLLAYCLRRSVTAPPPVSLMEQVLRQLQFEPDVHGVQIAIRTLLDIQLLARLRHPDHAEEPIRDARCFDRGEARRLAIKVADLQKPA